MRILDGNIVRDMTAEEEAQFIRDHENLPPIPEEAEEALTRYANSITGSDDPDLNSAAETLIEQRIKEES